MFSIGISKIHKCAKYASVQNAQMSFIQKGLHTRPCPLNLTTKCLLKIRRNFLGYKSLNLSDSKNYRFISSSNCCASHRKTTVHALYNHTK